MRTFNTGVSFPKPAADAVGVETTAVLSPTIKYEGLE